MLNLYQKIKNKFTISKYIPLQVVKKKDYTHFKTTSKKLIIATHCGRAGVNWLALGIESGNKVVRKDVVKGRFTDVNIHDLVKKIQDAGIDVIGNYIFGLPEDTVESMQDTLDMAIDLNCEFANFYSAMAYPGSKLYLDAIKEGWSLPDTYVGYSQHSYETKPLDTKHISAAEVLKFRDEAFQTYYTNEKYLKLVEDKYSLKTRQGIEDMTKIKLKRKILGD